MSDTSGISANDQSHRTSSLCIFSWLGVQAGALALAGFRVPMWARAPSTVEFLTMEILLTVQIISAGLFSRALLAGWRAAAIAIVTTWPFIILAGLLAARSTPTILCAGLFVSGWIVVVSIWQTVCSTERSGMALAAIASGWAAAGPIWLFLRSEYGSTLPQIPTPLPTPLFGPLLNAISLCNADVLPGKSLSWLMIIVPGVLGAVALWTKKIIESRRRREVRTVA